MLALLNIISLQKELKYQNRRTIRQKKHLTKNIENQSFNMLMNDKPV